ncbi:hypothetical protein [Streptomyces sp. NPDC001843]|uniref:hypothetical protein n=1 Tax=Streptomyces sp. NPDC001843 TaxID=3364617 RepID=UPI0036A4EC7E
MLFFTETEAREWATTGKKAADGPNPAALTAQAGPAQLQELRQLVRHWDTVREKGDPKTSPAVDAFHVLFDGHPAASALGPLGDEQFATVALRRVPTRTWNRLAPQIGPRDGDSRFLALSAVFVNDVGAAAGCR